MNNKTYSIGEVSKLTDISISTLRYYDKCGLFDTINRTEGNIRAFSDDDIARLNMINCLKNTGMQLKDIRQYFEWCEIGDSTIGERYQMMLDRKAETEHQIATLQKSLDLINYKCDLYSRAKEAGTMEVLQKKAM